MPGGGTARGGLCCAPSPLPKGGFCAGGAAEGLQALGAEVTPPIAPPQNDCSRYGPRGHLASLHGAGDSKALARYLYGQANTDNIWMGLWDQEHVSHGGAELLTPPPPPRGCPGPPTQAPAEPPPRAHTDPPRLGHPLSLYPRHPLTPHPGHTLTPHPGHTLTPCLGHPLTPDPEKPLTPTPGTH